MVAVVERVLAAGVAPRRCGVICFYRAQVQLVKSLLDGRMPALAAERRNRRRQGRRLRAQGQGGDVGSEEGAEEAEDDDEEEEEGGSVQVATVDAFQGAEKDVIVLTTSVTRPGAFAAEPCRLNVALTRARHNLVVVGCGPALQATAPALAAVLAKARATPGGFHPGASLALPRAPALAQQHHDAPSATPGAGI